MQLRLHARYHQYMDPIEMLTIAEEMALHIRAIARLESHPRSNAEAIEMHRQEALDCNERINAFLLISPTFAGI